jgi:hypothetical protein
MISFYFLDPRPAFMFLKKTTSQHLSSWRKILFNCFRVNKLDYWMFQVRRSRMLGGWIFRSSFQSQNKYSCSYIYIWLFFSSNKGDLETLATKSCSSYVRWWRTFTTCSFLVLFWNYSFCALWPFLDGDTRAIHKNMAPLIRYLYLITRTTKMKIIFLF